MTTNKNNWRKRVQEVEDTKKDSTINSNIKLKTRPVMCTDSKWMTSKIWNPTKDDKILNGMKSRKTKKL